ncbi:MULTISPECIES: pentapeptide repeat-containing protein, partial [Rothia]
MSHDNIHPSGEDQVTSNPQRRPWYIQHFTKLLIGFGLAGGTIALILPWALWLLCGMTPDNSDLLRLHLLYVTGGIIAVLTLLQTNWKNQGDRLKIDDDIKKNEQDAKKNERDHVRQVHAERRSRYTKAVEQLANENAAVRLGGVYTLVGLVDEWLADESISDRHQEGQVIINNLCSYIRSPFPLAEKIDEYKAHKKFEELKEKESENLLSGVEPFELKALSKRFTNSQDYKEPEDITADYATFHEEQDVRRTIFVEMGKRSSVISNKEESDAMLTPGAWSDFDFDFRRAPIFYPLNELTIEKGNFSGAKFYADANFFKVAFTSSTDFRKATFISSPDFSEATFINDVTFSDATFNSDVY